MDDRSGGGEPTIVAARQIWSRATLALERGTLTEHDYVAAGRRLRELAATIDMPGRSRVELYLELLEQAWTDRGPRRRPGDHDVLVTAHRVLAAGFAETGDRSARRRRARAALRELEQLAVAADDEWDRLTIVRLADPLLRLLAAIDQCGTEVLQ